MVSVSSEHSQGFRNSAKFKGNLEPGNASFSQPLAIGSRNLVMSIIIAEFARENVFLIHSHLRLVYVVLAAHGPRLKRIDPCRKTTGRNCLCGLTSEHSQGFDTSSKENARSWAGNASFSDYLRLALKVMTY